MYSRLAWMFGTLLYLLMGAAQAAPGGDSDDDCIGAPPNAVMKLPQDLIALGAKIYCTPFGHVIAARSDWIWTQPGAYSPVLIPAQMVRENPQQIGHQAHFTQIDTGPASVEQVREVRTAFKKIFPADNLDGPTLRLDVRGYAGRSLTLIFIDTGGSPWGIWCSQGECPSDSIFMLLDRSKRPASPPR